MGRLSVLHPLDPLPARLIGESLQCLSLKMLKCQLYLGFGWPGPEPCGWTWGGGAGAARIGREMKAKIANIPK